MSIEKDNDIKNAVKVVCGHCNGSGTVYNTIFVEGGDGMLEPTIEADMCNACTGTGHHFMQEWISNDPVDPPTHDMVHQLYRRGF